MIFQTEKDKEAFLEDVQYYKECLMKEDRTLTDEQATLMARQTISNLNISFIMADVCNSFLTDTESSLKKMKMKLAREDKHRFSLMQNAVKTARVMASACARPLYRMKDTDDACDCSDYYYRIIQLIESRITDPRKSGMLVEFLMTMPDEEKLYDVKVEDFLA